MDWIETLSETRGRLLLLMRRAPRSVSELAEAVGVSTNAVRTHVAGLERDGFVGVSGVERSTGGKPAKLYELTPEAEELFPKAYALVLRELVELFREETGEEGAESVLRRIGRRLAVRGAGSSGGAGESGEVRVRRAAAVLESIGGSVEVAEVEGGWVLSSAGCPLSGVVADVPAVCALAESLVAEVTGRGVEERCERGDRPRCSFRVSGELRAEGAG